MIKYMLKARLGTADTEAILQYFARNNVRHPTHKAFAELGNAVKTIFPRRYLGGRSSAAYLSNDPPPRRT